MQFLLMAVMSNNPDSSNTAARSFVKKSLLYSQYYIEACNEWRDPSPRHSAWATQLRRNVAAVASRCDTEFDMTSPGIEPQTSAVECDVFTTTPTG